MLHSLGIGLSLTKRNIIKRKSDKKMSKKIVYKYGTLKVRTIRPSKTTKKHFQVVVRNDRGIKQALKTMHMRS
tara:strand:- start:2327 stop:2545 length:219 start_codon:yes stop_codon:yes gene_type:complete